MAQGGRPTSRVAYAVRRQAPGELAADLGHAGRSVQGAASLIDAAANAGERGHRIAVSDGSWALSEPS